MESSQAKIINDEPAFYATIATGTVEDAAVSPFLSLVSFAPGAIPTGRSESQTMQNPQAIETLFKGVLYRSRLEARWATFFDHLKLDYTYEPEGYVLPSGWYLPDFYVRDWKVFIEVKAKDGYCPEAVVKGFELQEATGKQVIMLVGLPYPRKYIGLMWPGDALAIGGEFSACNHCDNGIALSRLGSHLTLLDNGCFNSRSGYSITKKLADAYRAAMSARFEHGEGVAL